MVINTRKSTLQTTASIAVFCYAVLAILTELAIAHGDTTLYPAWARQIYVYTIFLCLVVAWLALLPKLKNRVEGTVLIPVLFFTFTTLYSNSGLSFGSVFDAFYSIFRIGGYLCLGYIGQIKVYDYFKTFMAMSALLGIIGFISFVTKLPIPYRIVDFYNDSYYAQYVNYGFTILFSELGAVRLCGLFNEPGAFGTIAAFILCADNYNLKDKKNLVIFIASCMAFSVAFVVISAVFLLLKVRKYPKVVLPIIIGGGILIILLFILASDNPIVSLFIERFNFEDGLISMDNRSGKTVEDAFISVLNGDNFLFGNGGGYLKSLGYEDTGSTFKTEVIDYGVLGFIILYGAVLWGALKKSKHNSIAIALTICFMISIYQRPHIFTLVHFVILFGGIQYILMIERNTKEAKCKL